MMFFNPKPLLPAFFCALLVSTQVLAEYESVSFGVGDFSGSGESCYSDGGQLSHAYDIARRFDNAMDDIGYSQALRYYDTSVDGRDFTEYPRYSY